MYYGDEPGIHEVRGSHGINQTFDIRSMFGWQPGIHGAPTVFFVNNGAAAWVSGSITSR